MPRHTLEELRAETFYSALAFGVFFCSPRIAAALARVVDRAARRDALRARRAGAAAGIGIALWRHPPTAAWARSRRTWC
jgi:hypothetical protein